MPHGTKFKIVCMQTFLWRTQKIASKCSIVFHKRLKTLTRSSAISAIVLIPGYNHSLCREKLTSFSRRREGARRQDGCLTSRTTVECTYWKWHQVGEFTRFGACADGSFTRPLTIKCLMKEPSVQCVFLEAPFLCPFCVCQSCFYSLLLLLQVLFQLPYTLLIMLSLEQPHSPTPSCKHCHGIFSTKLCLYNFLYRKTILYF